MSLKYEPSSEPLHISAKWLFLNLEVAVEDVLRVLEEVVPAGGFSVGPWGVGSSNKTKKRLISALGVDAVEAILRVLKQIVPAVGFSVNPLGIRFWVPGLISSSSCTRAGRSQGR